MKKQISKIFSSDGELSKNIKGFKPRAEQLEMAQSVGYAIQNKRPLVVEAGTGTGKTFAYLAPALIAGKNFTYLFFHNACYLKIGEDFIIIRVIYICILIFYIK